MPLRLALAVRETMAGNRLGALEGGREPPPFPMHRCPHPPSGANIIPIPGARCPVHGAQSTAPASGSWCQGPEPPASARTDLVTNYREDLLQAVRNVLRRRVLDRAGLDHKRGEALCRGLGDPRGGLLDVVLRRRAAWRGRGQCTAPSAATGGAGTRGCGAQTGARRTGDGPGLRPAEFGRSANGVLGLSARR